MNLTRWALHSLRCGGRLLNEPDYDLAVLYMMSVAIIMGGAFDPANERGRRLAEEVLRRSCASVLDRGLLARIPGGPPPAEPAARLSFPAS